MVTDLPATLRQRHALTHLARLARRRPQEVTLLHKALHGRLEQLGRLAIEVAIETGEPMGKALVEVLRAEATTVIAHRLHDLIPSETVVLRELALEATRLLVESELREGADAERSVAMLHNYAQRLIMLGQVEQAQDLARQTSRILEHRAAGGDLDARLFIGVARVHADTGSHREAVAALNSALASLRDHSRSGDAAALSDLAFALHNLAACLSDLHQQQAAYEAIEEAVRIRRYLYQAGHIDQKPHLANSLLVAGAITSDRDQPAQALRWVDQSIALFEPLAERDPDAHRPSLAAALQNRASTLFDLGRYPEAVKVAAEAAGILSELATAHPQAFGPALVSTLRTMVNASTALRDWNAALAVASQAEALARQLQPASHVTRREALAEALAAKGAALHGLQRRHEATEAFKECLALRRGLAADDPARYRPDLVRALNNFANGVGWNAEHALALACAREAVALLGDGPRQRCPPSDPIVAAALDTLGCRLAAMLRHRAALRQTADACLALADAFKRLPRRYKDWMNTFVGHVETLATHTPEREAAWVLARIRGRLERPIFRGRPAGASLCDDPEAVGRMLGRIERAAALCRSERARRELRFRLSAARRKA